MAAHDDTISMYFCKMALDSLGKTMNQESKHGYLRKSIRLKEFDYSQPGVYFVTIVTQSRSCLFGKIENGEMILNSAGEMVKQVCFEVEKHLNWVDLGEFQVMPNHLHIIIKLGLSEWMESNSLEKTNIGSRAKTILNNRKGQISLIDVVSRIKSLTTHRYIQGVRNDQWLSFPERLWQRSL